MQLTHKIALKPTDSQREYFNRAAGTARLVWNWGLAEWNRQYAEGLKPKAMELKKQFNQIKYIEYPWLCEMHRDSHAQPFANLAKAWQRFFSDKKRNKQSYKPRFKKKGKAKDSFYVANDKFRLEGQEIILPKIGKVKLCETLRFEGKILGATVSRTANRWFIAIQVEVPERIAIKKRNADGIVGVDLGITAAATLSTGEKIISPKPLAKAMRRLQIRQRHVSRKTDSTNRKKSSGRLAKLHARIANLRADFTHKLTTRLCCENQTIVIEDLHVKGMLANHKLARAINDVGFGAIRQQLEYKSKRYKTNLIIADRWYPSSKLCSYCGFKQEKLALKDREWECPSCQIQHDRDINAANNLKGLATPTALPVANFLATEDTVLRNLLGRVGKVTPVSYECGQ